MTDSSTPEPDERRDLDEPRDLDELLSAELDGELEAAARDLGLTPEAARARIAQDASAPERRRALERARDLLAEPPEFDELVAARLRAKAVRDAAGRQAEADIERGRRRRRFFAGTAGIAAAAVAIAAVAAGLNSNSVGGSSKAASAPARAESPVAHPSLAAPAGVPTTAVTSLGTFTDAHLLAVAALARVDTLGKRVESSATTNAPPPSSRGVVPGSSNQQFSNSATAKNTDQTSVVPAVGSSAAGAADKSVASPVPTCAAPSSVPSGDTEVLRMTATLAGTPVLVVVFAGSGEHVVVVEDSTCHLLDVQMLG